MPPTLDEYRWRVANIILGGTTLRNQGAAGVEAAAREFVAAMDLRRFVVDSEEAFQQELDLQTARLQSSLPAGARNWGAARKAINLFLGEAYYHRFICDAYGLAKIERFLEVPLDSQVAERLSRHAGAFLPTWRSIKTLAPEENRQYQEFARLVAERFEDGWARIHLDVILWRGEQRIRQGS